MSQDRDNCGWIASDTCIYSPDVVIVRDDSDLLCDRLPPEQFVKVVVAGAWHEALKEYRQKFDLIDFVIYVSDFPAKRAGGEHNLDVFTKEFTE